MPSLKNRTIFEIARGLKAFLRLDAGLTRGKVPDFERELKAQTKRLNRTRYRVERQAARLNKQSDRLKQLRERLASSKQQSDGLREQLASSKQQSDGLRERLASSKQQSDGLREQLASSKQQVDELEAQLSNSDHRLLDLRNKLEVVSAGALVTARKTPPVAKQERSLAILDDVFPHPLSAFRIAEYNAYLEEWDDATVFSTASSFSAFRLETRSFQEVLDEYTSRYPQFEGRVRKFDATSDLEDKLVYVMFLNNASMFLDAIHAYNTPFVLTLYPGGRFQLDDEASDENLRKVCSSPNLDKIIITQKAAHEYLLNKSFCDPEKIEFVYGGVFPVDRLLEQELPKQRYKEDKDTLDICFVAHKYTERGTDKGYDVFIETARLLSEAYGDVYYHVVGPFDATDVDVSGIEDKITFYGTRPTGFFPDFYTRMDAIISPNAPFLLAPGAFDGFPTGGCIEAGSCGVGVFCTDPLNQNVAFEDGEEIVVVPRDAEAICEAVSGYHERPEALRRLSIKGQEAFRRVFDTKAQMEPRLRILSELMGRDLPSEGGCRQQSSQRETHGHPSP